MFMKRLIETVPWRLVGWALLAALVFGAGWEAQGWRKDAEISAINEDRSRERETQAHAQAKAVDDARTEERRITDVQTRNANEAIKQLKAAQASALAADAAGRELRARIAALANAARRPDDPAAVAAGAATRDPVLLLADVLGRADQRAGDLAKYADAARIAGRQCERDYGVLTADPRTFRGADEKGLSDSD
jgi:Protein of unknown function (DUF2514)